MKKLHFLKSLFLFFAFLTVVSCDNEAVEGEFFDETINIAEAGEFLCNKGDAKFVAVTTVAVLFEDGSMQLLATSADGEVVTLFVANAGVGQFDLTAGSGVLNSASFMLAEETTNPYTSAGINGGDGTLIFTQFDIENKFVTGTFQFLGVRAALDDTGAPILNEDGTPQIETLDVNNGAFTEIPFTIENGPGEIPEDEFFAKVDNVDFVPTEITVTRELVSDVPVIKIVAVDENLASIRIDVPESQMLGEAAMVNISNGTQLIGIYRSASGQDNLTSNPGIINITSISSQAGRISATFNFTGTDPLNVNDTVVEVTEGSFAVSYTPEALAEPFFAKIDDVDYIPDDIQSFTSLINDVEYVTIRAIDTAEQEIRISFPLNATAGNYNLVPEIINGDELTATFAPDLENNPTTFTSITGTITIRSYDQETGVIEASFSFSATDPDGVDPIQYEITEGFLF